MLDKGLFPRGLAVALLSLMVAVADPVGANAATEIYTVRDVSVDVTAESAAKAREKALARAHELAFGRLIARIVPRGAQGRLPETSYDRIATLVRDFEVANEKTSSVRYLADLTLRFQRQAVRGYLRANEVPFAETRSKPVVVLPLYGAAGDAVLWNGTNPWRDAWANRSGDAGLVPLEVPIGDLQDMNAISAQAALNQSPEPLERIAARYGAEDALVTQALPAGQAAQGGASAQIITRRVGAEGQEQTWIDTVRQRQGEGLGEMYGRAADKVAREVERTWKLANVVRFESEAHLIARVALTGLDRWVGVRERLESVPLIGESQVRKLSRGEAVLALTYYGDTRQLRRALAQADLVLERRPRGDGGAGGSQDGGPEWLIRPAEAAAAEEQG
jgi:hypothetical protein